MSVKYRLQAEHFSESARDSSSSHRQKRRTMLECIKKSPQTNQSVHLRQVDHNYHQIDCYSLEP